MSLPFAASSLCRVLMPAALAMLLAGCGGNSQGLFGAPGTDIDPALGGQRISDQAVAGVGGRSPAAVAPAPLTMGSGPDAVELSCPVVDVRSGAATWQVPAPGGGLRYQGSIGNLARECAIVGNTMTMKVGMEGRVLLGDKGTAGGVSVPIRIAVVQEGPSPKTILTKFFTVPLNIPAAEGQTTFNVVEDTISFPITNPGDIEKYVVYVGFDPKGTPEAKPRSTTPARPRPPAAASAPAAAAPAAPAPAAAAPAPAAPAAASGGTFGPPPSAGSTFAAPPASGTFGPPPATFGPPPAQ